MRGLSLVAASGGHSSSRRAGLSLSWPLPLRSTGSRRTGSVVVAHGPSCSMACGIFPDQGSNPCPLHWQADSQPLRHQGSPWLTFEFFPERCQEPSLGSLSQGLTRDLGHDHPLAPHFPATSPGHLDVYLPHFMLLHRLFAGPPPFLPLSSFIGT